MLVWYFRAEALLMYPDQLAESHAGDTPRRTPERPSQSSGTATQPIVLDSPTPLSPPPAPRLDAVVSQSPIQNLETVKKYLSERGDDRPLHEVELLGLVSLLKESVQGVLEAVLVFLFSQCLL